MTELMGDGATTLRQRQEHMHALTMRFQELERQQHRAVREALLGDSDAFDRLKELDTAIAEVRARLAEARLEVP